MNRYEAAAILEPLSLGCDPSTGEVLHPDSVLAQADVREALSVAVLALKKSTYTKRPPAHPITDDDPLRRRFFNGDRPIDIVKDLKLDYPDHIVFVQNGFFWEVYEDDADVCSRVFGWKIASHGTGHNFTGVPTNAYKFKERLEDEGLSYVMVAQTEYPSTTGYVERAPAELFSAHGV